MRRNFSFSTSLARSSDGGGLRDLIASAIDRGIPVVIGVPLRNLGIWREFAGEFAIELTDDVREVEKWLESLQGEQC
jgi:hypothetical protein